MLSLSVRSNRLLSISIRAISLENEKYTLQIVTSDGQSFCSNETEMTMLPKFELDRSNKEMTKFLLGTGDPKLKFILLAKKDIKLIEFSVDLGELVLMCDELSKAKIKSYPIIIFEFREGYYTTKDLFMFNTLHENQNPFDVSNPLNQSLIKNGNAVQLDKKFTASGVNNYLLSSATFQRREINFIVYNEKIKQYDFFKQQTEKYSSETKESLAALDSKLISTNDVYHSNFIKYEKFINIQKMRNQILNLNEKIETYENTIESFKRVLSQKQSDLHISSSIFSMNKVNYEERKQNIDKNFKKIEKYKIMNNAFVNKKLIEVSFFFFNRSLNKYYFIPPFYNKKFDASGANLRYHFYEKNSKEFATMMGKIAQMINYLSKLFNISLKYPLFINGSKSFIVKDKKDFTALYSVPKNEERHLKFELALSYLQENLREIMNHFHVTEIDLSEKENILTPGASPFEVNVNAYTKSTNDNFFSDFVKLNKFLAKMIERNKFLDDIYFGGENFLII